MLSTRWCGEGSTLAARPWQVVVVVVVVFVVGVVVFVVVVFVVVGFQGFQVRCVHVLVICFLSCAMLLFI